MRNVAEGFLAERISQIHWAAGKLANAPLFIDDSSGLSILQLRAKLAASSAIRQNNSSSLLPGNCSTRRRRGENPSRGNRGQSANGIKALAKE